MAATTKKVPAKKTPVKKETEKKAPVKKTTAKKTTGVKTAAKKPAEKKQRDRVFISEADQYLFGQGIHYDIYKKLGAHLSCEDGVEGVHFAV